MTDATQAILPVTQAELQIARQICDALFLGDAKDPHTMVANIIARHRQAHSLPGDVGRREGHVHLLRRELKKMTDLYEELQGHPTAFSREARAVLAALTPSALSRDAEARALEACPILDSERTDRDVGLARGSWRRGYKAAHQGAGG